MASSRKKHHPKHSLVFVDGDGWEGLYVDGKLYEEGHHVDLLAALKVLGIITIKTQYPDQEWLEERGNLPEDLNDVLEDEG